MIKGGKNASLFPRSFSNGTYSLRGKSVVVLLLVIASVSSNWTLDGSVGLTYTVVEVVKT